jgi:hypothetical protein
MHARTTWLLLALLTSAVPSHAAKPPKVQWTKLYCGLSATEGHCVVQTRDRGFVACGVAYSDTGAYGICYVVKANSRGETEWQMIDDWASESDGRSIVQTKDGGYIVTGTASPRNSPDSAGTYLLRLNSKGKVVWQKVIDRFRVGFSVLQTNDGGFVVAELLPCADSGVGLVKTDSLGNLGWKKRYDMFYGMWSDCIPLGHTADGGFIIGAKTLIKVDSSGVLQWMKTFSGVFAAYSVVQTPDHGYAATGFLEPDSNGVGDDMYLLKTDSAGNLRWERTYAYGGIGYWVELGTKGGLVAAGAPRHRDVGGLILRTDSVGALTWQVPLRSSAQCVARTADGGYIITGCSRGQLVLTKLAPDRSR